MGPGPVVASQTQAIPLPQHHSVWAGLPSVVTTYLNPPLTTQPQTGRCRFRPMELHRGVALEVNGTVGGAAAHGKMRFLNAGGRGLVTSGAGPVVTSPAGDDVICDQ